MKKIKIKQALLVGLISYLITIQLNIILLITKFPVITFIGYLAPISIAIGLLELFKYKTTRFNGFKIWAIPVGTSIAILEILWLLKNI